MFLRSSPEHSSARLARGPPAHSESTAFERICPRHGLSISYRYGDGRVRCKRRVGEAVTRRHQRLTRTLVDEAGGCCAVCGYDRTVINLHFHHVDPAAKSFNITMGRGKSLAACQEEARMCARPRQLPRRDRGGDPAVAAREVDARDAEPG
jgi:hypothetical protein